MTKEEQIEEIAGIIFESEIDDGIAFCDVYELGFAERIGRNLIEKGYRKADGVRKETAREILNLVYQRVKDISGKSEYLLDDESIYDDSSFVNVLNNIGRKYGVEVEDERE